MRTKQPQDIVVRGVSQRAYKSNHADNKDNHGIAKDDNIHYVKSDKREYTCPTCNKTFIRGNLSCLVMHLPVDCCHYGDYEMLINQAMSADSYPLVVGSHDK